MKLLSTASRRQPLATSFTVLRSLSLSPRQAASLEDSVIASLGKVYHPTTGEAVSRRGSGLLRKVSVLPHPTSSGVDVEITLAPFSAAAAGAVASLRSAAEQAALASEEVRKLISSGIQVTAKSSVVAAKHARPALTNAGPALAGLGSAVAVSSCKGGVGKSSVATNLAFALGSLGGQAALFDADIYGPSLPTMVAKAQRMEQDASGAIRSSTVGMAPVIHRLGNGRILPVEVVAPNSNETAQAASVGCMSYGWLAPRRKGESINRDGSEQDDAVSRLISDGSAPAIMRGPMVTTVVNQVLRGTEWGQRDTLVVDMPPGTGDIGITLGQSLPLTCAVLVTTPQRLALVDVLKGAEMFRAMKVPIAAVVLNQAHFDATLVLEDGRRHTQRFYPYGDGRKAVEALAQQQGIPYVLSLPIDPAISASGDSGVPAVIAQPDSETAAVYKTLAEIVATECELRVAQAEGRASSNATADTGVFISRRAGLLGTTADKATTTTTASAVVLVTFDSSANSLRVRESLGGKVVTEASLPARTVRLACHCAACVDEFTHQPKIKPEAIPVDITVASVAEKGNYGVAVAFSDGHSSGLFSYDQLLALAKAQK